MNDEHGTPRRRDPTTQDTTAYDYVQQVAVLTDENAHTGADVAVYAIGIAIFILYFAILLCQNENSIVSSRESVITEYET